MIFMRIMPFLPPGAAREKKNFSGTPRTPAEDYVLCTSVFEKQKS